MLPENLRSFRVPEPVLHVITRLQRSGHAAFLVGGCVRDIVRGAAPKDFDVATSAHPKEVQRSFPKVIPTGIDHGTVTVVMDREHVEVTTFRTESGYVDGRRPTAVEFKREVHEDLSRRDFTMNAMAFDPVARVLVDPFQGKRDLDARLIRCVGSAMARFSEDGLRGLRAVRFAAVLGFEIEPETEHAIRATLEVFRKVSQERIRVEFEKLLLSTGCARGLELLHTTGLLGSFLPEAEGEGIRERRWAAQRCPPELEVRLAATLLHCEAKRAKEALKRLTFPNRIVEGTYALLSHPMPLGEPSDVELRSWLSRIGLEAAPRGVALAAAMEGGADEALVTRATLHIAARPPVSAKDLALDGAGIMRVLGVGPSRIVGDATRHLLEQVIADPARNSASALEEILLAWREAREG